MQRSPHKFPQLLLPFHTANLPAHLTAPPSLSVSIFNTAFIAPAAVFYGSGFVPAAGFTPEGSNELLLATGELTQSHITLLTWEDIIISFYKWRTASGA